MANFLKNLFSGIAVAPDNDLRTRLTEKARQLAVSNGWSWAGPVEIGSGSHDSEPVWIVTSNAASRGQSARVMIHKSDLETVHAGYLPR